MDEAYPIGPMVAEVKANSPDPDACMVSFSGGKDAWCTWLALGGHFKTIQPFAYYLVPGLELVDSYLDYCERRMGCHIVRLPSPQLYGMLSTYVFQSPPHAMPIEAAKLPSLTWDDNSRQTEIAAGLPKNTWTAVGTRAADSIGRSSAFKRHGTVNHKRKVFHPIAGWNKADVVNALTKEKIKLSPEYPLFGRSFDGLYLLYAWNLKQHCPSDYAKCLEWFPLMECEVFRLEQALEKYGSMESLPRHIIIPEAAKIEKASNWFPNRTKQQPAQPAAPIKDKYDAVNIVAKRAAIQTKAITDSEFMFCLYFRDLSWLAVVFEDSAQKNIVLAKTKLIRHGDKYLDGEFVAAQLGIKFGRAYNRFDPIRFPTPPNPLAKIKHTGNPEIDAPADLAALYASFPAPHAWIGTDAAKFAAAAHWPDRQLIWGAEICAHLGIELPPTTYFYRPSHRADRKLNELALPIDGAA